MLQYSDLRLDGFFPGLLVPTESAVPLTIGFTLLTVSIFTQTWTSTLAGLLLRLALAPIAIQQFLQYGYGTYYTPGVEIDVGLAVVGLYGVMRILETTFVTLLDNEVPRWVVNGEKVPLPDKFLGRVVYTVDLATSLRGNSWFADTHWDWAPRALLPSPKSQQPTRAAFLLTNGLSLLIQFLGLDILDSIDKSRTWPRGITNPITQLPWYEQLVFTTSVCAQTALSITVPFTMISCIAVALGGHPASWPPMFDRPFTGTTSLADFWTRRWHAIFRRVFGRLALAVRCAVPIPRAVVIFGFSALLHILLMYRVDMNSDADPRTFLDPSILKFFLSQPLGLFFEALFVLPLIAKVVPPQWQAVAGRVWAWAWMLWAGRYWSDVWVHRGFWEEQERVVGWSVVRGVLYGRWAI